MIRQPTADMEAVNELAELATSKPTFKFVALLAEYYAPHEIVLILRAAVKAGIGIAPHAAGCGCAECKKVRRAAENK